jgi:hypothetical protein
MKLLLQILCALALGLTAVPPVLLCLETIDAALMKKLMLIGAVLWFAAVIALDRISNRDAVPGAGK